MKSLRVALWIWYRGDAFRGFQRQVEGPTVQEALEAGLKAAGVRGAPLPAGRTDKGVHARMQVVSLRLPKALPLQALLDALLPRLPSTVGVAQARLSHPSFHAQWSSIGKEYRYRVAQRPTPNWEVCSWCPWSDERLRGLTPNLPRALELLRLAVGRRDFIAFHEKSSLQKLRTLSQVDLEEPEPGLFELRLRGDAFGRHQVRYLVGSAIAASCGALPESAFLAGVFEGAPFQGVRAPAQGLILWEVTYPEAIDPFADVRERGAGVPRLPPFWTAEPASPGA